jgi:hypothetical protein
MATVRLQEVKFPDIPVDVAEHRRAHTTAASRQLAQAGCNLVFLSMNWGFPPEEEQPFWGQFRDAARVYHEQGFRVIGYVQASNCVARGSFAARDWYAVTPQGRKIPYYQNRLMTCWNHRDWTAQVTSRAEHVIEAGGDGVFFDNVWMGATPWLLAGRPGGFAGCACARCAEDFARSSGHALVTTLREDAASRAWLDWRAGIVRARLTEWAAAVRALRTDAWVLANNSDIMLRDTASMFGLDPVALAPLQDALLVENIAMPRFDRRRRCLAANALTVKALRATLPDRPVLTVTYERGIGLDGPPPAARLARALAESAALGAAPVLKGSEYVDPQRRFTVLTSPALAPVLDSVAPLLTWMDRNRDLFADVTPDPDAWVLYDVRALGADFDDAARATYAVATALLAEGVAFGFITPDRLDLACDRTVLIPPGVEPLSAPGVRAVRVEPGRIHPLDRGPTMMRARGLRSVLDPPLRWLSHAYFTSMRLRRAFDAAGITARFLQSAYFRIPAEPARVRELIAPTRAMLRAAGPVLVERWSRSDGACLIHLLNYSEQPVQIALPGVWGRPSLHSPDPDTRLNTDRGLHLETYAVLELDSNRSSD